MRPLPTPPMPETALKLEDSLHRILDALPDAVTVQDRDGSLIYANEAAAEVVGFESPAAMLAAGGRAVISDFTTTRADGQPRSEERRVGKECRSRRSPSH